LLTPSLRSSGKINRAFDFYDALMTFLRAMLGLTFFDLAYSIAKILVNVKGS